VSPRLAPSTSPAEWLHTDRIRSICCVSRRSTSKRRHAECNLAAQGGVPSPGAIYLFQLTSPIRSRQLEEVDGQSPTGASPPAGPLEARQQKCGSAQAERAAGHGHADLRRSRQVIRGALHRQHAGASMRVRDLVAVGPRITGLPPRPPPVTWPYIREGRGQHARGAGLTHHRSRRWGLHNRPPPPRGPRSLGGGADIRRRSSRYGTRCCART
jgi:hypothetical protein